MATFETSSIEDWKDFLGTKVKLDDATLKKIAERCVENAGKSVKGKVQNNAPSYLKKHVKQSKTYRTPSDGGVNSKIYFSGYLPFKNGRKSFTRGGYTTTKGIPAAFLAMIREYGSSYRYTNDGEFRGKVQRSPFIRKAFYGGSIERVMAETFKRETGIS